MFNRFIVETLINKLDLNQMTLSEAKKMVKKELRDTHRSQDKKEIYI